MKRMMLTGEMLSSFPYSIKKYAIDHSLKEICWPTYGSFDQLVSLKSRGHDQQTVCVAWHL